jgi:hypothetical protein
MNNQQISGNMKKLIYTVSFLLFACSTFAQDLTDALRYSNYKIKGTARSAAMGNAFGALGGDFTSLSINPAGVAVYRSGEFTFTPSLGNTSVDGKYLGNTENDSKYNVSLDNLGYVTTIPTGANSESGVVSFSFGLGFNRLGNFSMRSLAGINKSNNSILDYFTDNMNSNKSQYIGNEAERLDPYYELLAWDSYLVNYDKTNDEYFNDISDYGYQQAQQKSTERKGYINEYLISFGANFNHKFYLGGTVGIHDVYYKETSTLREWYPDQKNPFFEELSFGSNFKTSGSGFNLKIGAIFKPTESLRLGLAFHSPTFYKLTDNYYNTMNSYNANYVVQKDASVSRTFNSYSFDSGDGTYDYEIQTPMKTILSAAYQFGKKALVSIDYEIVDYSSAKLKNGSDGYDYYNQNQVIKDAYKTVGNLHVGAEYRISPVFSLRAGYENYPSAFKSTYINQNSMNKNASYSTVSGGFGFRQGNVFVDAAVKHVMTDEYLNLYPSAPEMAKYNTKQNSVIFTIGYKF